jgi:N-acetylneuraminic acid mutarotase
MVSIGDSIYIIGGRLCFKKRAHLELDEFIDVNVEILSTVYRYNVRLDEWTKCASLKTARYDFACTVCENKIFVAGGHSNLNCARGISSAEMYDPIIDTWAALPTMSTLRYKCVGVTWQGKIHVVGGFTERGGDGDSSAWFIDRSSAEVYDTSAERWDLVDGMWQLDVPPNQIVALENRLFSSGDCLVTWKGHIETYDGKLNMWNEVDGSRLETLSSPISTADNESWPPIQRLYLTMAPIGTHLYFLAGYRMAGESSRTMSVVYVFDTSATRDAWRNFEVMEEEGEKEFCSHCCVVQLS